MFVVGLRGRFDQATLQLVVAENHWTTLLIAGLVAAVAGCAHGKDRKPPGVPPTPTSITREEPGGDANDPHHAALERLATGEWGWRNDRRDVFHFPLSDWPNWRRVKFWGLPTFVAFRYGDAHRAVAALWVRRLREEDPEDLQVCLDRMEAWAQPIAEAYRTQFTRGEPTYASWKSKDDVMIQTINADVAGFFSRSSYRAVVGVSFAWPRVCVMYGYAFRAEEDEALVDTVRERYVKEAFSRLTVNDPHRSPDGLEELPSASDDEDESSNP